MQKYESWLGWRSGYHNRSIYNKVIESLIYSNKHANKWCCASETSAEFYRCKINIALENSSHHFYWHCKHPSFRELQSFGCGIYPITPKPNKLNDRKKYHSWVIPKSEQQWNCGIHTKRNSSTDNINNLMHITTSSVKVVPLVPIC